MRVHFDVTCLMPRRISGIGVYARELYRALMAEGIDLEPVTKLSRIFKSSAVEDHIGVRERTFWGVVESLKGRSIIQGPDFRLLSKSNRFLKIVTIHDLAVFHEGFNEHSFRIKGQQATRDVLYKGQPHVVIADTEVIANEIRERFVEFRDRVQCIPPGSDHLFNKRIVKPEKKQPYFLFAGHLETRKNVMGILKAFEILVQKNKSVRLILVGKDGYQANDIRRYISTSPARTNIDIKGFVSEDELRTLYASATAFVFPSFYEGFGFPILEAMSLGCPVITSNFGAMSELAGDAALLVDPRSEENIAFAMENLLESTSRLQELVARGQERFREFTWKKCAQANIKIYQSLG